MNESQIIKELHVTFPTNGHSDEGKPALLTAAQLHGEVPVIRVAIPPGSPEKLSLDGILRFRTGQYRPYSEDCDPRRTIQVEPVWDDGHRGLLITVLPIVHEAPAVD